MKRILYTGCFLVGIIFFSNSYSFAQDDHLGELKVGGGLIFGSEVESIGLQANGVYRISERVAGAADLSFFFPDEDDTGLDSWWALNANIHYILAAEDAYHLYGLGGLNIATLSSAFVDESNSELGINLGGGGEYHLENFSLFGEIKYIISDFDQVELALGVRFAID